MSKRKQEDIDESNDSSEVDLINGKDGHLDSSEESSSDDDDSSEDYGLSASESSDDDESEEESDEETSDAEVTASETTTKYVPAETKTNEVPPIGETKDEYEYDSSDEEDIRNTVGNVPMEWYREYQHIGYNLLGQKIIKPETKDGLDEFLDKMENPDYWRTVKDKMMGQDVVLTEKDMDTIQNFRKGRLLDQNIDPYAPWVDFFTHETMEMPLTAHPPHKRSFIPSLWEKKRVSRLVDLIKQGKLQPVKHLKDPFADDAEEEDMFYALWKPEDESEVSKRVKHHIPAPKMALPGHAESYNPPKEYLFTKEEEEAWLAADPEDRKLNFIPRRYGSLRSVPQYERHMEERFHRCLDLYLCPRQRKMRMNVDPEDLLPKLPKPRELQPFPNVQSIVFRGHTDLVRTISVSPESGKYLASGSDDGSLRLWDTATTRCFHTMQLGVGRGGEGGGGGVEGVVRIVAWNPNPGLSLVAAAVGNDIVIINPPHQLFDSLVVKNTDSMIAAYSEEDGAGATKPGASLATWTACTDPEKYAQGLRITISHEAKVEHLSWHGKGDYLAVVLAETKGKATLLIHQLSRRRSQNPLKKPKGIIQRVMFHPTRPYLFVATQRYVRVYNLLKQELTKKLMTNCKWVSSLAIHPGGDNVIIGSYDCKLGWFDLDLSSKPYQTLRHHKKAVRSVCYHPRLPLFASGSDDGTVIVCHGRVYNDLLKNPLIVPVKILRGHETVRKLGVLDVAFHPTQPWLFSSGADATIRLYTN